MLNFGPAQTYRLVAKHLERGHFGWLQKGAWFRNDTDAATTYYTMLRLMNTPPPGTFQSTITQLKMHRIGLWMFDITQDVRLGGRYAPTLAGPTPRALVPLGVSGVQPPPNFVLPAHTRDSAAAREPTNWRQYVLFFSTHILTDAAMGHQLA